MKMLLVGAGVIGTVYGAHVAAGGSKVSVLSQGPRTSGVAAAGLSARDVLGSSRRLGRRHLIPDWPLLGPDHAVADGRAALRRALAARRGGDAISCVRQ